MGGCSAISLRTIVGIWILVCKNTLIILQSRYMCIYLQKAEDGLSKLRSLSRLTLLSLCLSFFFLLGQCKEHDLAMINQLLDDPKLTARKYREWKVMNTLLIQDIYQQHQQRRTPTSASEGSPQKPPSSARLENSIWEQARMLSPPVLPLRQLFKTLR